MQNEDFNDYMIFFKSQSLAEKQSIILEQLKILTGYTNNMCSSLNIKNDILLNDELLDLKNNEYSQDDFAEALIVYINSIQNSLNDYNIGLDRITDILIESDN